MAVRYHLAGTTDWSNAASWHDGVYGASGVPADTDSVYFLEGSDNVSSGMSQSGIDLALVSESAGFNGSVGTAGTPLTLEATNTQSMIFNKGGNGRWNVNAHIPTLYMRSGYLGLVGGGETLAATVSGGELYCGDSVDLNTNTITVLNGMVTIEYRASDSPVITINGGKVILRRLFGALVINGGSLTVEVMKSISSSTSITQNGGHLDWRAGYVSTWTPKGGTATFANQVKPITIANAVVFSGTKISGKLGANGLAVTYAGGQTEIVPSDWG